MRSEYGKLVYLLMDSQKREIKQLMEFTCVRYTDVSFHYICFLHLSKEIKLPFVLGLHCNGSAAYIKRCHIVLIKVTHLHVLTSYLSTLHNLSCYKQNDVNRPIQTVHTLLEEKDGLNMLDDPLVQVL